MIALKSCPNCGSYSIRQCLRNGTEPHVVHEISPGVNVEVAIITIYYKCKNCGLIFQNPRLSDAELNKFYGKDYYHRTINATGDEMKDSELDRAKTDSEIIKQYVGKITKHLDIGCGSGYLLDAVGAEVKVGVETDVGYIKVNAMNVYGSIERVPVDTFDIVTAVHVLEHVSKPLDYIKKMTKFVKKGGYLIIEVPTWKSEGGPFRLAHLYHFEPSVLKEMCTQVDLGVVHEEFTPHLLIICQKKEDLE